MQQSAVFTIYVPHTEDCPHKGDEFYKRCNCVKHIRWSENGKQFTRNTRSRMWTGALRCAAKMASARRIVEA